MFQQLKTWYNQNHVNLGHNLIFGLIFALAIHTAVPAKVVEVPVSIVQVVKVPTYINEKDRAQIRCLAENAYFEARNQSRQGMIAVTNVVMNRTKDSRFPKTPCAVVYQRNHGVCQFSWVCGRGAAIRERDLYQISQRVAEDVYLGNVQDITRGSLFYHADYVSPGWRRAKTVKIGSHIFYR